MGETTAANWDERTLAFYGALLGLVILDLILMIWILNPFTPSVPLTLIKHREAPAVSDSAKPSPFEVALKASTPAKRTPKVRNAQASIVMPAFVKQPD